MWSPGPKPLAILLSLRSVGRPFQEVRSAWPKTIVLGQVFAVVPGHPRGGSGDEFGGVGPSGMGAYHGVDGFRTFSHARPVYRQSRLDVTAMLRPPYGKTIQRLLALKLRR